MNLRHYNKPLHSIWSYIILLSYLINFINGAVATSDYHPKVTITTEKQVATEIKYFDDSSNILVLRRSVLSISFDDGASYKVVEETKDDKIIHLELDKFNKLRAFAFTLSNNQYVTNDQGKTWQKFEIKHDKSEKLDLVSIPLITLNAKSPDLALFDYYDCPDKMFNAKCKRIYFYTQDGFKTNPKRLNIDSSVCKFSKSNLEFDNTQDQDSTIYCAKHTLNSFGHVVESNVAKSSDFFNKVDLINHHHSNNGKIIDIRIESNFLILVVQNDKFNENSRVSILVSKNGHHFHNTDLRLGTAYGLMTFLEASPSSFFVSVMEFKGISSSGTFYGSDSAGTRLTKLLGDINDGAIKKIDNIDGAWLANTGTIAESTDGSTNLIDLLIGGGSSKDVVSKYSFNDGQDWHPLVVNNDKDCKTSSGCSLHLLNPTERNGEGDYVTGPTPGILLAVGSKGRKLDREIENMRTWISRDGGASWDLAIEEPCLFSFGDQGNVIVAIPFYAGIDKLSISKFYFSLDQGKSFQEESIEHPIFPLTLTTTVDGTSRKFILSGLIDNTPEDHHDFDFSESMYAIDFTDAFEGKVCEDGDFEDVYARVTINEEPICVYGHKEKFNRRKQNAQCFVNKLFEDVKVYEDSCECTAADFECASGFEPAEDKSCQPLHRNIAHMCMMQKVKELNIPNKVLMDGNKCSMGKKKASEFITNQKLKCSDFLESHEGSDDGTDKGTTHDIVVEVNEFLGELQQYAYIEGDKDMSFENVIIRTADFQAYISNDGGFVFRKVPVDDKIIGFYEGYAAGHVILVTDSKVIYVSHDGGATFVKQIAPTTPIPRRKSISFNKIDPHQFIWYGSEQCTTDDCPVEAYITKDNGKSFDSLSEDVIICDFVGSIFDQSANPDKDLIYCSVLDRSQRRIKLVSSRNGFKDSEIKFDYIVGYAITGDFVVVATVNQEKKSLQAKVTVDGSVFADADFPADFHVESQQAYTILDSQSRAIFMHVTTNTEAGKEYGSILKSNSNGTSYVLSLSDVNRNRVGYVDYDRIEGLEGVIISNVVIGVDSKGNKELSTQITHNDGGEWAALVPPVTNSDGQKYGCTGQSLERCSLHLHGFTERDDYRDTFSSASATGLIIGVGSVGKSLDTYERSSTFMSNDGGITWKEIKRGVYMWEYGDRGTILVLVPAKNETDTLSYSLDEGTTWLDYKFADKPINVLDLATVPSDTSRKFLIFGYVTGAKTSTLTYAIDFSGIHRRQCQLDLDNPANDDYVYWSPSHPKLPDNCLFGHEAKYLRRAVGHNDCFIGSAPLSEGFKVIRNCSCTRRDYECDYNYYRDTDNTCKLVKGLSPTDRENEYCKKENAFEYFEPTGYRKIPLSTCNGGQEFDSWHAKACPGKEKEFNQHYGKEVKGYKLFLLVFIPIFVFVFATGFVYDRGIRRNGGFKRLGQIRLDLEDDDFNPIEDNQVDVVVNRIVRGGIFAMAATFATFKAIQKIDRIILDKLTSAIFRRTPGRRNYVQVPDLDDEDELFGDFRDDYEEEINEGTANLDQEFTDGSENDDLNNVTTEETETDVDSRLFGIDDHSDEESHPELL
ncbi:vacuolar protein sorting/targeting protein 10 [Scheffersomyces coipomensis]|uniref:vacuolar protein sorting/targeting protein 10 n=1 Tax=Scheffersomyces coipomensis TaxID=1788519 RepID=UPI00315D9C2A